MNKAAKTKNIAVKAAKTSPSKEKLSIKDGARSPESARDARLQKLHTWNKWLALAHAVQAAAILLISTTRTFPITTNYLTLDPLASEASGNPVLALATRTLAEVNIAHLVAAFFIISAIAHATAAWWCRKSYEVNLSQGVNRIRWFEYAASASVMLVSIALLTGVSDASSLLMIFMFSAVMNLLGLAMEVYNVGKSQPNWLAFIIGCIAGVVPWIVLAAYLAGSSAYGTGQIPAFVYWIYGSLFVFFDCFALNMWLQYKKVGKWANYLYGERMYMILSLVAKSALAWQVFFGALRP